MPFNMKKHRKCLVAAGLLVGAATPGFAIFGLGDIVFDPSSWAELLVQATTAATQLQTIENNLTHFSFKRYLADRANHDAAGFGRQPVRRDQRHDGCAQ